MVPTSSLARRSPLHALANELAGASTAVLRMAEVPFLSQIDLRGHPQDGCFLEAARGVLGCDLPMIANTFTRTADVDALWLGPDEWLLVRAAGDAADLERRLREALAGRHVSIADVSDGRAVLELAGPRARNVLMHGTSLDVHPRQFKPGQCAQTLLARIPIVLQQSSDEPDYRIFVASSFAAYIAKWLCDAAREYSIPK
jgi:sarcosine oxidase, subunit gamma